MTLNPSGPQVLYAALPAPITLAFGAEYVVALATLSWYYVQVVTGLTAVQPYAGFSSWTSGALTSFAYNDNYQLDSQHQPYLPLSALGCIAEQQPQPFVAADTQLYSFCSYTQQSQAAPDPQDYSMQASSSLSVYSGLLAVSASSGSSSFGSYNSILAATALSIVTNTGGYLDATGNSVTRSLVWGGSTISPPASQLLYPSGAAANTDLDGPSLLSAQGLQIVLRYSGNGSAIYTVTSTGVITSSSLSTISIQPYNWTGGGMDGPLAHLPDCTPPLTTYTFSPLTCPDGFAYVEYGWSNAEWNPLNRVGTPWPYYAQLMGNLVFFFLFAPQLPGSSAYELTVLLSDAPARLLHLRLGLFTRANDSGPFSLPEATFTTSIFESSQTFPFRVLTSFWDFPFLSIQRGTSVPLYNGT